MQLSTPPPALTPTGDSAPVLQALLESMTAGQPPEVYLRITENRADGGATVRHAWSTGGQPLGDHVDQIALAAGLDAADWLHIGDLHSRRTERGRFGIEAFPLRPILGTIQAGQHRCPEDRRDAVRRFIAAAARDVGRHPVPDIPRWLGMGPALVSRRTP